MVATWNRTDSSTCKPPTPTAQLPKQHHLLHDPAFNPVTLARKVLFISQSTPVSSQSTPVSSQFPSPTWEHALDVTVDKRANALAAMPMRGKVGSGHVVVGVDSNLFIDLSK